MSRFFNQINKILTNYLPKTGMFILTGFSTSFLYFYYSMLKLFQHHQASMLSEEYQTRFKSAACSSVTPSTCFWQKYENASPHRLNDFSHEMLASLPFIGLVGGATITFLYHHGDKIIPQSLFGQNQENVDRLLPLTQRRIQR
jgi:hypothetical protein